VWQPAEGLFMLTVICKATFDLVPEESPLASDQDEPTIHDQHWNDDENASLRAASDIVPFKRGADVLLVGHAYAPTVLSEWPYHARLMVGNAIDKTIEIHGDRVWTKDDRLVESPCPPRTSLRWERAGGGPGTSNPVGIFPVSLVEPGQPRRLPNLEPPRTRLARPTDVIPPIGFGPLAPSWPERKEKIDTREGDWDPKVWHTKPLAPWVDASFFHVAPTDQHVDRLTGDERIQLEHLHPEYHRFSTRLAPTHPHAVVHKAGNTSMDVDLRCDTLVIDTDRRVCTLTWRGSVPLAYAEESARVELSMGHKPRPSSLSNGSNSTVVLSFEEAVRTSSPALPFAVQDFSEHPRLDPSSIPIERFATISAELNEGQTTRFRILETHALKNDDWQAIEKHWKQAIDDESAAGKHGLRKAYDAAYLATVERFRGPITPDERAKVLASLERGKAHATLDELKIQRAALLPILRSVTTKEQGLPALDPARGNAP